MTPLLLAPARPRTSTRRFVVVLAALVVVLRLGYLVGALHPDEAGYLTVARAWHLGGPNLYGHYFVDRPPGLLLLFRLASVVPWDPFVRVLVLPFVLLFVASAAWAAHQLVGERGARWAAVTAAALTVSPALGAQEADGEIFAVGLVMLAVALTVAAVRRPGWPGAGIAVLAGLSGGLAVMVKQNFGDAFVFATALLVASVVQGRLPARRGARVALGGLVGGLVVLLGALGYTLVAGVSVSRAWFSLFGFRGSALDVIADYSLHAPATRALTLLGLAVVSGVIPLVVVLARGAWRCHLTGPPVAWAIAATLAVETVGIVAGGSYWPHYLLQVAPMLALAVGLWAPHARELRLVALLTVGSALVATALAVLGGWGDASTEGQRTGQWVAASSRAGDTATVLYGHVEVQQASGLGSPYPHLWTLPMRTLDPRLHRLHRLLTSRRAPDWVVVWSGLEHWDLDPRGTTRLDLATHYRVVRQVCGHQVWLRDGLRRSLAPAPSSC